MGDVFEEDDTVTIIKDESSRAAKTKNLKNHTEEEIRLVILNPMKNEPVLLPVRGTKTIGVSSLNFSNKIELYRFKMALAICIKSIIYSLYVYLEEMEKVMVSLFGKDLNMSYL